MVQQHNKNAHQSYISYPRTIPKLKTLILKLEFVILNPVTHNWKPETSKFDTGILKPEFSTFIQETST